MQPVEWRRYLDAYWGVRLISEAPGWREYRIDNPSGSIICRSMLMRYEFAMLYALARNHYTGAGAIVDGGPLTGITTNTFAKGILSNPAITDRKRRIFAFDLFDHISHQDTLEHVPNRNGSIMDTFLEVNRDYLDIISVAPGDILSHPWNSGPIEVALIDIAKSWDLNSFVVDQWFPHVTPGGYVVQQDYFAYSAYWLPITMMFLKEYFEFVDYAMGGSTIFRCVKPVPPGMGSVIRELPFKQHEALLTQAADSAPLPGAPVLTTARACFYTACGMPDEAHSLLDTIQTTRMTEDYAIDFHAIAIGSVDAVRFLAGLPAEQLAQYGVAQLHHAARSREASI